MSSYWQRIAFSQTVQNLELLSRYDLNQQLFQNAMQLSEDRIEIDVSEIRDLNEHKNMLVGGVDYLFRSNEEVPAISEEVALRTDKIILYFDTNKQEINLTDDKRNYLDR